MAKTEQGTVRIRWVRSGIAFNRKQAEIVRALGLRRLQHVVERPDTAVFRGLIAKVPHLIEVLDSAHPQASTSVPEYTIIPPTGQAENAAPAAEPIAEPAESGPHLADAAAVEPVAPAAEPQTEPKPKRRVRTPKAKAEADETAGAEAED